jgi:hypothetical protein
MGGNRVAVDGKRGACQNAPYVYDGDHTYDPSDIKRMLPHTYFKR